MATAPVGGRWHRAAILLGAEFDAELARERSIRAGNPSENEPYVPLRDQP